MNRYPLPPWLQGHDHWTLMSLPFWFSLPEWTADQAAALVFGIDPERDTPDCLVMLDGVSIESTFKEPVSAKFLADIRRDQNRFLIAASAANKSSAPPEEWISFAQDSGITPEWLDLVTDQNNSVVDQPTGLRIDYVIDQSSNKSGTAPSSDEKDLPEWVKAAIVIANEIGLKHLSYGVNQITARGICDAVANKLAKHPEYHGTRGPRTGNNIRNVALKGWKFIPPSDQD